MHWIIDLGPEGWVKGGEIVTEGTPEKLAKIERSFNHPYFAPMLSRRTQITVQTSAVFRHSGRAGLLALRTDS